MMWRPNVESEEPIYRQIASYIENQIMQGELLPGSRLPTERELAMRYAIHRSTVTAAYAELRAWGYIYSVQGRGTCVSESLWGITPKRIPNWNEYNNTGWYHPSNILIDRIREGKRAADAIDLSFSKMPEDLLPREEIQNLLPHTSLKESLNYADARGSVHLREVISAHLEKQYNIKASKEQILITMGAEHALYLIAHRLLSPGDSIALEANSYIYTKSMFASAGLRLYPIVSDDEGLIPEELESLIHKKKIRLVFINPTYQNPTGTTLPLERRVKLLEICERHRIPIVEDDPYGALHHDDAPIAPMPLKAIHSESQSIIYVGTLTKSAAPAFRIGWIAAPKLIVKRLSEKKAETGYTAHTFSEMIAAHYLESGTWQQQVQRIRTALTSRKLQLIHQLKQQFGDRMIFRAPQGGYYLWARHYLPLSDLELIEAGIGQGILFVPGSVYGGGQGSVRFCFLNENEERIMQGMQRLKEVLHRLPLQ